MISGTVAERLAALVPKFVPPGVATPPPPVEPAVEDQPRNGIVRLPSYIVRERPAPTFIDRRILTPQGKLDLALKLFPGLRFGNVGFLRNDGIALFMLEDELRLQRLAEATDLAGLVRISDLAAGAALLKDIHQTFIIKAPHGGTQSIRFAGDRPLSAGASR